MYEAHVSLGTKGHTSRYETMSEAADAVRKSAERNGFQLINDGENADELGWKIVHTASGRTVGRANVYRR